MVIKVIKHPYLDRFSKSFVVDDGKVQVLIDTGMAQGAAMIEEAAPNPVAVLCTHGHFDHIGCHRHFQKKGAKIYAHKGDVKTMEDHDYQWMLLYTQFGEDFDIPQIRKTVFFEGVGEPFKVDCLVKDGDVLKFGDIEIQVLETPGHSAGGVCYYVPELKALFTGDTVNGDGFYGGIPQIADVEAYLKTHEYLKTLDVERAYCCHGEIAWNKEEFAQVLEEGEAFARRLIAHTEEYLKTHEVPAQVKPVTDYIRECEGGRGPGSAACIAGAAGLAYFKDKYRLESVCGKYIL